jgi:dTDP-4-amino-4,6-dideoxygalactose transaminase
MSSPHIPIFDPKPQIEALWPELQAAFERVMKSGCFILGPEVEAFEAECAQYLGVKHAIGLNSGTDALFIALRALGIGPGDEVITTPFTFFATAEAISHVGATPVFVDIEEDSFNINPDLIAPAITSLTKAILPVHLFGRPCDMDRIGAVADAHGLKVVEDCAQSFGASWRGRQTGVLGDFGCFSFFPTKNLSAFGDGGLIVTNDDDLATSARMFRAHGSKKKYFNETVGYNSRLDEIQAALLRVKLPHVSIWNAMRRTAAVSYHSHLTHVPGLIVPELVDGHVFNQFTVRIQGGVRNKLQAKLREMGIGTNVYYPVGIHQQKVYQVTHHGTSCPVTEATVEEVLSLPIGPEVGPMVPIRVSEALACTIGAF